MSKTIVTLEGQSIIDIAVEHCGNVDRIIDIVENNAIVTVNDPTGVDVDLSEALVVGQEIIILDEWVEKKIIVEVNKLATAE